MNLLRPTLDHPTHLLFSDLANCAAVCKNWVPRSRAHQFKTIDFTLPSSWDGLSVLLDLAAAPLATIAPRQLELPIDQDLPAFPTADLLRVGSLSTLRSLVLTGISIPEPQTADIVTVLGSLSQLRCLELANVIFDSFIGLRDIVVARPELERLYLKTVHRVWAPRSRSPTPNLPAPCPSFQLLCIVDCDYYRDMFDWVTPLKQLECICIDFARILHSQAAFGSLLLALGPSLRQLCVLHKPKHTPYHGKRPMRPFHFVRSMFPSSAFRSH